MIVRMLAAATLGLASALAAAAAEPPRQLWLYCPTNLQVNANVPKLEALFRRAARAGYTHVLLADSKMARLGDLGGMERVYMANVEKVKAIARELNLELVPAIFRIGYSNAMLWHDPNLAEGLPVEGTLMEVRGNEARVVPDPPVAFGARPSFHDDWVVLEGGVATVDEPFRQNARFTYRLAVSPRRCYHVSVKVRTKDFTGEPKVMVLGKPGPLQYENLGVKPSQDWTEHHVVFNSLDNAQVAVYFGVWGGGKGTLEWKDWRIEEVALLNVLRRPGTPLEVKLDGGRALVEGKGFEPVADPKLGRKQWAGEYESYHAPPALRTRGLPDGTRLRVSWYHPAIIHDGQVTCCPSEPRTMELLADEFRRVHAAFDARGYMMSHDEVRSLNTDLSCARRNLAAGQILADNARACTRLLAGRTAYVWSDMFDPHHNARKDYYLVRGDLAGSWEGLDRSVVIVNWNFDKRDESLKFFADRGHRQVIAGYYDADPRQVLRWLDSAAKVQGVVGVMYTTWRNDYSKLEEFAALVKERR